jgi:uncharacterized repeat protein (TIGR01451 family)
MTTTLLRSSLRLELPILLMFGLLFGTVWQPVLKGTLPHFGIDDAPDQRIALQDPTAGLSIEMAERMAARGMQEPDRFVQEEHLSASNPAYRASNPGQNWQVTLSKAGTKLAPLRCQGCPTKDWQWHLVVTGYGYGDQLQPVLAEPKIRLGEHNQLYLDWGPDLHEWYTNHEPGLKQNFALSSPPLRNAADAIRGTEGYLSIEMVLSTNLVPQVSPDGQTIHFHNKRGETTLSYSGLYVFDAAGRTLPAHLEIMQPASASDHVYVMRIVVDDAHAVYPVIVDPLVAGETANLAASDSQAGARFGSVAALSGDTAVIGAPLEDGIGLTIADAGAAYVFERDMGGANNWGELKKLTASDAQALDQFGASVAVSGDIIAVGAPLENGGPGDLLGDAGAVYIFGRNVGGTANWGEVKKLLASSAQPRDQFGVSVALTEDSLLVGAPYSNDVMGVTGDDNGTAYLFQRNAGGADNWGEVKKLVASDAQARDQFGLSVALSGHTAIVGAPQENGGAGDPLDDAGAIYIFGCDVGGADNWGERSKLTDANAAPRDHFGSAVAIGENVVLIGAPLRNGGVDDSLDDAGEAYVYHLAYVPTDVAIVKSVTPTLAIPGQFITYTLAFSNVGPGLSQNVVISDPIPPNLEVTEVTSLTIGTDVTIMQNGSMPNLFWHVSDLEVGEGGMITVTARVVDNLELFETRITNTVTITATDDITPAQNTATVFLTLLQPATLTITKTVVGHTPPTDWAFVGDGLIGSFTLTNTGGSQSFRLLPSTYTISETVKPDYETSAHCTDGTSGQASVTVTLSAGTHIGCEFVGTFQEKHHYLPIITWRYEAQR